MKTKLVLSALACGILVQSAFSQAGIPPDEVVVSINGVDYTMGHIDRIRNNLPQAFRQQPMHMNTRNFIDTFAYLQTLAQLAEDEKLLEREPYKSQFEFNRTNYLAQTYLQTLASKVEISEEDKTDYLERNKSEYEEARVSAIYIDFSPVPEMAEKAGKEVVTEQQAWEKAQGLLSQLRQGADFGTIARQNSDDEASAANGGDLGVFSPDQSGISDTVKQEIFALNEGQVSSAVKDGARFYIFKVTQKNSKPLAEIQGEMLPKVHQEKLRGLMDSIRNGMEIVYKSEAFENGRPTTAQ